MYGLSRMCMGSPNTYEYHMHIWEAHIGIHIWDYPICVWAKIHVWDRTVRRVVLVVAYQWEDGKFQD